MQSPVLYILGRKMKTANTILLHFWDMMFFYIIGRLVYNFMLNIRLLRSLNMHRNWADMH